MELNLDEGNGLYIRSYRPGCIGMDDSTYSTSIIVTPEQVTPWRPTTLNDLAEADLLQLLEFKPKVILLGTGKILQFPPVALWRQLIEKNVGYEIMDTAAACRTYNVLMAENRSVVAGLLIS